MPPSGKMEKIKNLAQKNILFIKFLLVGGLNTLFGYGLFAFFVWLGLHYTAAVFLSTVLGVLFNFKTTGLLVFKNGDNGLLFKFLGVYIITYLTNITLIKFCSLLGAGVYLAGALAVLPVAALSFIMLKRFVFNKDLL